MGNLKDAMSKGVNPVMGFIDRFTVYPQEDDKRRNTMIKKFTDKYMENVDQVRTDISKEHPSYEDIVIAVVRAISPSGDKSGYPDFKHITEIDDGDYQGTLLYLLPEGCYQPYRYWYVFVSYGSCSGCDTLQGIRELGDYTEAPTEEQMKDYMTLALHITQGIKLLGEEI